MAEERHASRCHPFRNVDISFLVKARIVRMDELPGGPVVRLPTDQENAAKIGRVEFLDNTVQSGDSIAFAQLARICAPASRRRNTIPVPGTAGDRVISTRRPE